MSGHQMWRLPGYIIDERLGRGGSGEVWRARVARTGQPVALKRLPLTDPAQVAAATTEAAVLAALDHPHLIRLHEVVRAPDALVLVLDLADGGSLADLLQRRGRLTPPEVVTALAPIGAALAYAHGEGIVHGDVSTGNVLFAAIGLPLLGDLGLARVIGDDAPVSATPAYLDPIVAMGHLPGPPTDVFSLAAVAVHALRGRPLWPGETAAQLIEAAAAAEIDDLETLLPDVPTAMRAVLGRALSPQPQLRCTAAEFALDLRHSLTPAPVELRAGRRPLEPGSAAPLGQLTYGVRLPPVHPAGPPRRRLRWRSAGRVAVLGIGLAAAVAAAVVLPGRFSAGGDAQGQVARPVPVSVITSTALAPSSVAPSSAATPTGGVSSTVAVPIHDPASAATVLAALDQLRERAFAQREPALLAQVYVAGDLLNQDSAALDRLVQPGCTLPGVHTTYSGVQLVAAAAGRTAVLVTATLAAATLTCAGSPAGVAPGSAPTPLHIELAQVDGHYLIAAQQLA